MTVAGAVALAALAVIAVIAALVFTYRRARSFEHAECVQLRLTVADLIKRMEGDRKQVAAAREYIAKLGRDGGTVTSLEIDAVLERLTEREISAFSVEEKRLTEKFAKVPKEP